MIIFRYDKNNYFMKGFFSKETFKKLMHLGVKYTKGHFFIPIPALDNVKNLLETPVVVNEDFQKYLFVGEMDRDKVQKATFFIPTENGQCIYLIHPDDASELINITKLRYFNMNRMTIQQYNLTMEKSLWVQDYFYNTEIGFNDYKALFYTNNKTLDLPQIINRVCLSAA